MVEMMVRMVEMMKMMLPWRLKQINSLPRHDDGDDDKYIMMQCVSRKIITSSWEFPVTT